MSSGCAEWPEAEWMYFGFRAGASGVEMFVGEVMDVGREVGSVLYV